MTWGTNLDNFAITALCGAKTDMKLWRFLWCHSKDGIWCRPYVQFTFDEAYGLSWNLSVHNEFCGSDNPSDVSELTLVWYPIDLWWGMMIIKYLIVIWWWSMLLWYLLWCKILLIWYPLRWTIRRVDPIIVVMTKLM